MAAANFRRVSQGHMNKPTGRNLISYWITRAQKYNMKWITRVQKYNMKLEKNKMQ
jgi:hypothetical protein